MPGCEGKCIEIKTCLFFCQISFNSEPSPDLIHTAATSVNAMENFVSGRNKMTWMLLLVAASAFSQFNCMWRSGLKILSVPGYAWRSTSSGKWEKACLSGSSDLPQMLGKVAVCGRKTWKRMGSSSSQLPAPYPHLTTADEAGLSPLLCSFIFISFDSSKSIPKTVYDAMVRHRNA